MPLNFVPRDSRGPAGKQSAAVVERLEGRRLLSVTLVTANAAGTAGGNDGSGGNGDGYDPTVSADGRYVAFVSEATDLVAGVAGDGANTTDILVRDTVAGTTEYVSVDTGGGPATGPVSASHPVISADGRYVTFASNADLLPGAHESIGIDTGFAADLFVRDRQTGVTTLITTSTPQGGGRDGLFDSQGDDFSTSADGRFVAYSNAVNGGGVIRVWDRDTNTYTAVSLKAGADPAADPFTQFAGGSSTSPQVSDDGRYVAFVSTATDLVAGQAVSGLNVYLRDTLAGTTTLVNPVGPDGAGTFARIAISPDGRFVTVSTTTNLLPADTGAGSDLYLFDRTDGSLALISGHDTFSNSATVARFSGDSRFVVFPSLTVGLLPAGVADAHTAQVLRRNLLTGVTDVVTLAAGGRATSEAGGEDPSVSADGRYVAFVSGATDLGGNITSDHDHVFLKDMQTGEVKLVSHNVAGSDGGNDSSAAPRITADGRQVAFTSDATDLVPNFVDGNGTDFVGDQDLFIGDGVTLSGGSGGGGGGGGGTTGAPDLSVTGVTVSGPTSVVGGAKGAAAVKIANVGDAAASGRATVRLFVSADGVLDDADRELVETAKTLKLKPGKAATLKFKFAYPADLPDGPYSVVAEVVPSAADADAGNDSTSGPAVTIAAPFVDLAASFAAALPAAPVQAGKRATVALNVSNVGNVPAAGKTSVRFSASADGVADPADVTLATVPVKLSLKPGKLKKLKLKFVVPADLAAGTYRLLGAVNPDGQIPESGSGDNTALAMGDFVLTAGA